MGTQQNAKPGSSRMSSELCPPWAPFFGFAGVAASMVLSTIGAAYGTAKAGIGISGMGTERPDLIMRSLTGLAAGHAIGIIGDSCARAFMQQPRVFVSMVLMLIFAEVIGLYGLIVALIMQTKIETKC